MPLAAAQRVLGRPGELSALRLGGCWCRIDVATLAGEVEKLVQTQSQDCEYLRIQFRDASPGKMLNEVIETSLPAKRAGDNLGGE